MKFTKKMEVMNNNILELVNKLKIELDSIEDIDNKIDIFNEVKLSLKEVSPMKHHPTDFVVWERADLVEVQKVNPNAVAPPEMELLYQSIKNDGYTMPVVSFRQPDGTVRIVDGFHRRQIEQNHSDISDSTYGRIPTSFIRRTQEDESNRMASTIRHNRARGTHSIEIMSTIVAELVEMGKGDRWICQHIGMSPDELLRLKQVTGVAALFNNKQFSDSWEPDREFYEEES